MALALVIGLLVGASCCFPFALAVRRLRASDPTDTVGLAALFAAPIAASFIVLAAGIAACAFIARDALLAFSCAEVGAFLVSVVVFGFASKRR